MKFGAVIRRHPLAVAIGLSLALHGVALAAAHYGLLGEGPELTRAQRVAVVLIESPAPTPAPAPQKVVTPKPQEAPAGAPPAQQQAVRPAPSPPPRRPAAPPETRIAPAAVPAPAPAPAPAHEAPGATAHEPSPAPQVASLGEEAAPATPPAYASPGRGNPRPYYPWLSRQRGEQGRVVLRVGVDASGKPVDVTIIRSSGHGRLDRAAAEALRQWRFTPARRSGRDVAGSVEVPVTFRLSDG
jgi:protein TonB